jgi:hypothetical protein
MSEFSADLQLVAAIQLAFVDGYYAATTPVQFCGYSQWPQRR